MMARVNASSSALVFIGRVSMPVCNLASHAKCVDATLNCYIPLKNGSTGQMYTNSDYSYTQFYISVDINYDGQVNL